MCLQTHPFASSAFIFPIVEQAEGKVSIYLLIQSVTDGLTLAIGKFFLISQRVVHSNTTKYP